MTTAIACALISAWISGALAGHYIASERARKAALKKELDHAKALEFIGLLAASQRKIRIPSAELDDLKAASAAAKLTLTAYVRQHCKKN